MARTRTYTAGALYGAGPVSTEFATGGGFGAMPGFAPLMAAQPAADAPAAAAFTGLAWSGLLPGAGRSFWRSEAGGFLYFLALAVILNRRLVNR